MATSSTFPAFKAALVTALDAVADCQVAYRWPGPDTADEGIYLADLEGSKDLATIKAGRKWRDETFRVEVICQSFSAARSLGDLAAADVRVAELEAFLDGVLADSPTLNVDGVQWSAVTSYRTETVPFERGLAIRLTATVSVTSRLT